MARCIAVIAAAVLSSGVAAAETTYIHAGHVLAVPGEGYLRQQTIKVEDGAIIAVEAGYQAAPAGARLIDLRSAYILPGLIDSHVHLLSEFSPTSRLKDLTHSETDFALEGAANARKTLMAGFTTVQDVGGADEAIFSLRDAVRNNLLPGPRIRASGRAVTPTGGHADGNGYSPALSEVFSGNTCNGADDCRRAVRQSIKNGADVIKITATGGVLSNTKAGLGQQLFDDEIAAIVETAKTMGRKVTAHAHGAEGINAALRNGVQSIEHGTYLNSESIRLFRENDATLIPTVLAGETVTGWTDEEWLPAPAREKAAEVGPRMVEMLAAARRGGVNVAFGTDTGVSRHGDNAQEFALMVRAGYTPEQAIRAATVAASAHVEMDDMIGTLEAGKRADMVAVQSDPLRDVSVLNQVGFVMKDGVVYKDE